jgi:hypothetical protein
MNSTQRSTKTFAVLMVVLGFVLLGSSSAQAAFTRQFERQLPGVTSPGGVGVSSEGDVWLGEENLLAGSEPLVKEFEPAAAENKPGPLAPFKVGLQPRAVAVQPSAPVGNGLIYVANSGNESRVEVYESDGTHVETWPAEFQAPRIAIDGVGCVIGCAVYVSEQGVSGGVRKFSATGAEESFSCVASKECEGYVHGGKITGIPGTSEGVFGGEGLVGVAVDGEGNIFAANKAGDAVYEYHASGKFVRAFEQQGVVPLLEGGLGDVTNIAVDPISDHLLVSADARIGQ